MRVVFLFSLILSAAAPRSCANQPEILEGMPVMISAPQFVVPNANFTLVVNFEGGTNGCAKAHGLALEGNDTLKVVKAYYIQETIEGQLCAAVMPVHELSIESTAPETGGVRFVTSDGVELAKVTVREAPAE
jgi:hypothetical protein